MRRSRRRLLWLLAAVPLVLVGAALLYMLGMAHLEGDPRTFGSSLEWAAETMTTTGYGKDASWSHPVMQAFVIVVQFAGVFLTFMLFPVFVIPFFEERFEGRLPTQIPKLKDYIVIYRWGPAVSSLVEELDHKRVPVVILEEDLSLARLLHDRGRHVLHVNLDEDDALLGQLSGARGLVANGTDQKNAVITVSARQRGFQGPIVALVANPSRRPPLQRAGATAVFTPRHALALAVAAKASDKISPRVSGVQSLGRHLEIAEMRVHRESDLVGKTLQEAHVRRRTGATIIGRWVGGELLAQPALRQPIEQGSILVAVGSQGAIRKLRDLIAPAETGGHFVIVGYEETGIKIAQFLRDAEEETRVIHTAAKEGVDLVGDVLDEERLREVGVADARAVILAIEDDSETLFGAAVVRDVAPETTIIASVKRAENVARIHRAGADHALSVSQVAGQLLAFQLLGEESFSVQPRIKLVRTLAGSLAGRKLLAARVTERTGCYIVAVERGSDVIVEFDPDFMLEERDVVYVSGTLDMISKYFETYPEVRP
jgi:Trk K+ transport system NAD-binding subunit